MLAAIVRRRAAASRARLVDASTAPRRCAVDDATTVARRRQSIHQFKRA